MKAYIVDTKNLDKSTLATFHGQEICMTSYDLLSENTVSINLNKRATTGIDRLFSIDVIEKAIYFPNDILELCKDVNPKLHQDLSFIESHPELFKSVDVGTVYYLTLETNDDYFNINGRILNPKHLSREVFISHYRTPLNFEYAFRLNENNIEANPETIGVSTEHFIKFIDKRKMFTAYSDLVRIELDNVESQEILYEKMHCLKSLYSNLLGIKSFRFKFTRFQ